MEIRTIYMFNMQNRKTYQLDLRSENDQHEVVKIDLSEYSTKSESKLETFKSTNPDEIINRWLNHSSNHIIAKSLAELTKYKLKWSAQFGYSSF